MLHPTSKLFQGWSLLVLCALLVAVVAVPLQLGFSQTRGGTVLRGLEAFTAAVFAADVLVHFRTAYITPQGELVRDSRAVARRYVRGALLPDLAAAAGPVGAALAAHPVTRIRVGWLALAKLARLVPLVRHSRRLTRGRASPLLALLALAGAMLLAAHWLACGWHWAYEATAHRGWIWHYSSTPASSGPANQYLHALYTSFLLLLGDRPAAGGNDLERVLLAAALLAGAVLYAVVVGSMSLLVSGLWSTASRHRQRAAMAGDALRYSGVGHALRHRVADYHDHLTVYEHPGPEGVAYLQDLSVGLHGTVTGGLFGPVLAKAPLFRHCEAPFVQRLAERLHLELHMQREVIYPPGSVGKEMYIVWNGAVALLKADGSMAALLCAGEAFGELGLGGSAGSGAREHMAVAVRSCDLLVLRRCDLQAAMKDFPNSAELVRERMRWHSQYREPGCGLWLAALVAGDSGFSVADAASSTDTASIRSTSSNGPGSGALQRQHEPDHRLQPEGSQTQHGSQEDTQQLAAAQAHCHASIRPPLRVELLGMSIEPGGHPTTFCRSPQPVAEGLEREPSQPEPQQQSQQEQRSLGLLGRLRATFSRRSRADRVPAQASEPMVAVGGIEGPHVPVDIDPELEAVQREPSLPSGEALAALSRRGASGSFHMGRSRLCLRAASSRRMQSVTTGVTACDIAGGNTDDIQQGREAQLAGLLQSVLLLGSSGGSRRRALQCETADEPSAQQRPSADGGTLVAGEPDCTTRGDGLSPTPHHAHFQKKKKKHDVLQHAPYQSSIRPVPVAALRNSSLHRSQRINPTLWIDSLLEQLDSVGSLSGASADSMNEVAPSERQGRWRQTDGAAPHVATLGPGQAYAHLLDLLTEGADIPAHVPRSAVGPHHAPQAYKDTTCLLLKTGDRFPPLPASAAAAAAAPSVSLSGAAAISYRTQPRRSVSAYRGDRRKSLQLASVPDHGHSHAPVATAGQRLSCSADRRLPRGPAADPALQQPNQLLLRSAPDEAFMQPASVSAGERRSRKARTFTGMTQVAPQDAALLMARHTASTYGCRTSVDLNARFGHRAASMDMPNAGPSRGPGYGMIASGLTTHGPRPFQPAAGWVGSGGEWSEESVDRPAAARLYKRRIAALEAELSACKVALAESEARIQQMMTAPLQVPTVAAAVEVAVAQRVPAAVEALAGRLDGALQHLQESVVAALSQVEGLSDQVSAADSRLQHLEQQDSAALGAGGVLGVRLDAATRGSDDGWLQQRKSLSGGAISTPKGSLPPLLQPPRAQPQWQGRTPGRSSSTSGASPSSSMKSSLPSRPIMQRGPTQRRRSAIVPQGILKREDRCKLMPGAEELAASDAAPGLPVRRGASDLTDDMPGPSAGRLPLAGRPAHEWTELRSVQKMELQHQPRHASEDGPGAAESVRRLQWAYPNPPNQQDTQSSLDGQTEVLPHEPKVQDVSVCEISATSGTARAV